MLDAKIRTLLALASAGSFTRAAQRLGVTQPAVSNHIRLLEQEYGVKIFKSNKKELVFSPEGKVLLKYARQLQAVCQSAEQALEDSKRRLEHLSIGITQTVGENLMPHVIAIYCAENPDTHIRVYTDTINKLYNKLALYKLDVAIVEGVLPGNQFDSILLDTDSLYLVVSPAHPFAARGSVGLDELKKEKLILRAGGAGTRSLFENCLEQRYESIKNFNVMMELDNIAMIKDLVELGVGVSVLSDRACIQELRRKKLAVVPLEDMEMTRKIHMVYQKDFTHRDLLDDFTRIYRAACAGRSVPEGDAK